MLETVVFMTVGRRYTTLMLKKVSFTSVSACVYDVDAWNSYFYYRFCVRIWRRCFKQLSLWPRLRTYTTSTLETVVFMSVFLRTYTTVMLETVFYVRVGGWYFTQLSLRRFLRTYTTSMLETVVFMTVFRVRIGRRFLKHVLWLFFFAYVYDVDAWDNDYFKIDFEVLSLMIYSGCLRYRMSM